MPTTTNNPRISNLIRQIDEIMHKLPWLDESFSKKLENLPEDKFFEQPGEGLHSIAENMSHLVEWRKELIYRFKTGEHSAILIESNWIPNEMLSEQPDLLRAFEDTFNDLQQLLLTKDDSFLDTPYFDKDFGFLLEGWLHHDIYHLGQIGLVLRMLNDQSDRSER